MWNPILTFAVFLVIAGTGAHAFELTSPDLTPGEPIPETFVYNGFGCTGGNQSPALTWTDPPEGTRSFALMVHDPDAPTGGAGIWHWVVVNLPASLRGLGRDAGTRDGAHLPPGARQIVTDFEVPGWNGPCPPVETGQHAYNFTLYALKVETLALPAVVTASHAGFYVVRNALAKATLTATYQRH